MGTKIEWQDFEDRMRRAQFTVDFSPQAQGGRHFLMPVYLVWSQPERPRRSLHDDLKIALVFAAVLAVGVGLGIGAAALLLP